MKTRTSKLLRPRGARGLLVAGLLLAVPARAETSLDHAGSASLVVAVGPEFATTAFSSCISCRTDATSSGFGGALDLGGTLAVGSEGGELALTLRLLRLSEEPGESLRFGYRKFFGREAWKSYLAFDLLGSARPIRAFGARAAFGGMRELSSVLGVFLELGSSIGVGQGRRLGVELLTGLQARSYLFE